MSVDTLDDLKVAAGISSPDDGSLYSRVKSLDKTAQKGLLSRAIGSISDWVKRHGPVDISDAYRAAKIEARIAEQEALREFWREYGVQGLRRKAMYGPGSATGAASGAAASAAESSGARGVRGSIMPGAAIGVGTGIPIGYLIGKSRAPEVEVHEG